MGTATEAVAEAVPDSVAALAHAVVAPRTPATASSRTVARLGELSRYRMEYVRHAERPAQLPVLAGVPGRPDRRPKPRYAGAFAM